MMEWLARARLKVTTLGRAFRRVHGPTWLVAVATYGGWLGLTLAHERLPLPLLVLLGGTAVAWQGSLQHEVIHGHPAGPRSLGALLAFPALSLWLPYAIYRDSHRRHHATRELADPEHDPEASLGATSRTILGRLTLGPLFMIASFVAAEARALVRGTPGHRKAWALHVAAVIPVLLWLVVVAGVPLWKYVVAFVYPGASLTLLRSFAEHRPDADRARRTTVVETGLYFRLLFLNNNLHVMHHEAPRAPWFELPRLWARRRAAFARRAPDLIYDGYTAFVGRPARGARAKAEAP